MKEMMEATEVSAMAEASADEARQRELWIQRLRDRQAVLRRELETMSSDSSMSDVERQRREAEIRASIARFDAEIATLTKCVYIQYIALLAITDDYCQA